MSTFKAKLRNAQQLYVQQKFTDALRACDTALEANEGSQDAILLQGKIHFQLKDFAKSESAYQKALQEQPKQLAAWKGLAELHVATSNTAAAAAAFESLIKHSSTETTEKRQEYHAKLAGLYIQLQQPEDAKKHLEPLLHGKHAYSDSKSRLHAACQMADVRMLNGEDIAELQLDLASIVSQTAPDAQYAHYHAKGLELALQHMEQLQSGSQQHSEQLKACQQQIKQVVASPCGGCCTATPFKQALLLSEHQDQPAESLPDQDAQATLQRMCSTLQHQFPWEPTACAAAGLALHHKLMQQSTGPSKAKDRKHVTQFLASGLGRKADSLQAWQLLCELYLQDKQAESASDASGQGIKCLHHRQSRGYQVLPDLSAKLVLARAESLLALGSFTDALSLFRALSDANHSSPVKKMLGPVPSAVRQAAIRGHAQVLKQTGKVNEAAAMLQSVVDEQDESKMQHGLFADFGSLLQAQGNFKDAKSWMMKAIQTATEAGPGVTDIALAEYKLDLGGVCWSLGPNSQADKAEAHGYWLAAAAVAGPHQSAAFAKLGIWYAQAKADLPRARKCFQRSLGLNPLQTEAAATPLATAAAWSGCLEQALASDLCSAFRFCTQSTVPACITPAFLAESNIRITSRRCKEKGHTQV